MTGRDKVGSPIGSRLARRSVERDGCLVWMGARDPEGYGRLRVGGVLVRTHRAAWEAANGPIPQGMVVRHVCDNPPCIRPDHLVVGSQRDNVQDALRKGRRPQNLAVTEAA
jgi:hypothetical protein